MGPPEYPHNTRKVGQLGVTAHVLLDGIKVVEYANYVAGPGCACMLAEWGATVIKVEPLGGDPHRQFLAAAGLNGGPNPVFELDNRGKRGIAVDTSTPAGVEILHRLVADADIFITNVRPASLDRAGLCPEALRAINPRLVYASFTGYGLTGDERDRPGFDIAAFWARTGLSRLMVPRDAEPLSPRSAFGDHVAALALTAGLLAALHERDRTGGGRVVESSLVRSALYTVGIDFSLQLAFGKVASTRARHEEINPAANYFCSRDDRWFVVVPRGRDGWKQVCAAAGCADMVDDPRFATAKGRRVHSCEIVSALDIGFRNFDYHKCIARMDDADLVWAPVQTLAEAARDPQIRAAGAVISVRDGDGHIFEAPAGPIRFPGAQSPDMVPAPRIGQHTAEIMSALGYSAADVGALQHQRIINAEPPQNATTEI